MDNAIEDKVKEGFSSLAGRTLGLLETLRPDLLSYVHKPSGRARLGLLRSNLVHVRDTGEIKSIGVSGARNLSQIIDTLDQAIPPEFKPDNPDDCLSFAVMAVGTHFGISGVEEFLRRTGLNSSRYTAGQSGIVSLIDPQGKMQRIFFSKFDPGRPAYSVIVNVNELHPTLRPESQEIYDILLAKSKIDGMDRLVSLINANKSLHERRIDIVMASHDLHFFSLPEVLEKARREGVEMEHLQAYLGTNVSRMDFLVCYLAGAAYVLQSDIIARAPALQEHRIPLQFYQLMALADALLAPFLPPKDTVYHVGIGLFEYFMTHKKEGEVLRHSAEFHRELSDTYFSRQPLLG